MGAHRGMSKRSQKAKKMTTRLVLCMLVAMILFCGTVSAAPVCNLVSITPGDIEANSTGPFECCIICNDTDGINTSRFFITKTVEGGINLSGPPNRWSIRPPANNWSESDPPLITEQILRSYNRGKGKWFDSYGIFTDNFSYGVHDGTALHVNITNGTTWAKLNYTWNVEPTAFRNMFFLVRTALESEEKKDFEIYGGSRLLVKFWDLEHMRGTENYTMCMFNNINVTGNPAHALKVYYCNASYNVSGSKKPQTSHNCVFIDSFTQADLENIYYESRNSSYSRSYFGVTSPVINQTIGGIKTTDTFYIYYMSTKPNKADNYKVRYANGSSGTNVSFADSNVAWSSTNRGTTWIQQSFTPDIWVATLKDGDQFQLGVYAENNTGLGNYTNLSFHSDPIGDWNYPITRPNIEYFYTGAGGYDYDLNGLHSGTMTIRVNIASDPDAQGTVNHSLYLCYPNGSIYSTINSSFYSSDDDDINVSFDATGVPNGIYRMNVTAVADDNHTDVQSYVTPENFSIGPGPTIISCNISGTEINEFAPGEKVYVQGHGLDPNTNYTIWIQYDQVNDSDSIVSGEDPSMTSPKNETVRTDAQGNFSVTLIWSIPPGAPVTNTPYDIVVDNQNRGTVGTYNAAHDGLDSASVAGIIAPVPEVLTVILFSVGLLTLAGYYRQRRRRN